MRKLAVVAVLLAMLVPGAAAVAAVSERPVPKRAVLAIDAVAAPAHSMPTRMVSGFDDPSWSYRRGGR